MTVLERLDKIHPDMISGFLTTGKCNGIPEDVQKFLKQIQWAAEIYEYEPNITRASKKLRLRINAEQKLALDERTCKERIYQAINYFNVDNNISEKVWENHYADKLESMAQLCAAKGDMKTMAACIERASEHRIRAAQIAEAATNLGITFIIDPNLRPEDMGLESKSLKEIARKHNEGFYIQLIDGLPIDKREKKRLLRDADIQDVEEILNEE